MTQMDVGLRHRLRRARRQIAAQHAQLRSLRQALEEALVRRDVEAVRDAVDQLRTAVKAHFSMETGVFFPALHGLYPDARRELEGFVREHEEFVSRMAGLRQGIVDDSLELFESAFATLGESISGHEAREERLIEAVMKQVDPT
ncbi:MAG: hemerythrin domain-containing protein [Myxococcota bacterium]